MGVSATGRANEQKKAKNRAEYIIEPFVSCRRSYDRRTAFFLLALHRLFRFKHGIVGDRSMRRRELGDHPRHLLGGLHAH